jgi:regulator of protease activity HflC (stomatin/prohibitin superfamily)
MAAQFPVGPGPVPAGDGEADAGQVSPGSVTDGQGPNGTHVPVSQGPALARQELGGATTIAERAAWFTEGIRVLALGIVVVLIGVVLVIVDGKTSAGGLLLSVICALVLLGGILLLRGLVPVAPGHPRVVQLFGKYRGTIRDQGMQWVNPFTERIVVSTRLRNLESAQLKVNDADGNPIEIAAVVVWQVRDTANAVYSVDDVTRFVTIQTETAVRHIASSYPYDSRGLERMSLRDNADEITERLSAELAARVRPAGVQIIETRLTRLSYAPEIAQAMLRQQQASAVVGARQRIVEGAVGMVQLALQRLEDEGVVELDEERKAAMVSNLLVVLCSEQATQQVVNTGSLYQ